MPAATESPFLPAQDAIPLEQPILEGPRHVNAFEGRVWTAQDVRDEQQAQHDHLVQLGRALGAGVIEGLWVTLQSGTQPASDAVVEVTRGRAINDKGQPLELANTKRIALTRTGTTGVEGGLFAPCGRAASGQTLTQGTWLLVLSPASGFQERAPKTPPTGNGVASGCGFRYAREGVQLRLVQLPLNLSEPPVGDVAAVSRFRNQVAHRCFGTLEMQHDYLLNPFTTQVGSTPGALGALRSSGTLTDCDVPLALIAFAQISVLFVDNWSVRRRPATRPLAVDPTTGNIYWPALVEDRRRAVAEAVMMQFQEHVRWLQSQPSLQLNTTAVTSFFASLPPAAAVPFAAAGQPSFSQVFFRGIAPNGGQPVPVPSTVIRAALSESLAHEPLLLSEGDSRSLYVIQPEPLADAADYAVFLRREIVNWRTDLRGAVP